MGRSPGNSPYESATVVRGTGRTMLLQGLQVSKSGLEAALCSALSWRPGAFRGATLACAEPVCGPGGLRVPCAPVPGARSPAAGGEHQGEESGQLRPRERVRGLAGPQSGAKVAANMNVDCTVWPEDRGRKNGRWSPEGRPKRRRGGEAEAAAAAAKPPSRLSALFCETAAAPGLYTRLRQSGPAPLPAGSLRPWGAGRCI